MGQVAAAVAPAVIGGIMGNKAAKHQAAADRYAVDQQMRPFNLKEPFLKDLYSGGQGALDDARHRRVHWLDLRWPRPDADAWHHRDGSLWRPVTRPRLVFYGHGFRLCAERSKHL